MLPTWYYELPVGTVGLGWRSFSIKGICGYSNMTFREGIWIRKQEWNLFSWHFADMAPSQREASGEKKCRGRFLVFNKSWSIKRVKTLFSSVLNIFDFWKVLSNNLKVTCNTTKTSHWPVGIKPDIQKDVLFLLSHAVSYHYNSEFEVSQLIVP